MTPLRRTALSTVLVLASLDVACGIDIGVAGDAGSGGPGDSGAPLRDARTIVPLHSDGATHDARASFDGSAPDRGGPALDAAVVDGGRASSLDDAEGAESSAEASTADTDAGLGDASDTECDGGITCSGICVSWASDPANCGGCGNSCNGAACNSGSCAGIPLVMQYASNRPIAVDANNVYFTAVTSGAGTGVSSVPVGGGTVTLLAPYRVGDALVIDDQYVYFTEQLAGLVTRVPKDGSAPPTTLATSTASGPEGIGVDASYVYYADANAGAVYRLAKGGGAPQAIATNEAGPMNLVVDANDVYFVASTSSELRRVALDGSGGALSLATNFVASQIAQSASDILYLNAGEVGTVPKSGGGTHPYVSLPPLQGIALAGFGNDLFYAYDGIGPSEITSVDLTSMQSNLTYYSDWSGNLPTQLAVVDSTWIYFIAGGMVERVAQ